jgi:hypothetical protein
MAGFFLGGLLGVGVQVAAKAKARFTSTQLVINEDDYIPFEKNFLPLSSLGIVSDMTIETHTVRGAPLWTLAIAWAGTCLSPKGCARPELLHDPILRHDGILGERARLSAG